MGLYICPGNPTSGAACAAKQWHHHHHHHQIITWQSVFGQLYYLWI